MDLGREKGAKTYLDHSITASATSQWGFFGNAELKTSICRNASYETCKSPPVLRIDIQIKCFKSQQLVALGPSGLHYGDTRPNCHFFLCPGTSVE